MRNDRDFTEAPPSVDLTDEPPTCASCGYEHNLCPDTRTPEIWFCLYCRERSVPAAEDDDIGGSG